MACSGRPPYRLRVATPKMGPNLTQTSRKSGLDGSVVPERSSPRPPLKPVELHVLLALSEQPLHGYALAERIAAISDRRLRLLPGNLYVVLHRLAARALLRETARQSPSEAGGEADGGEDSTDARRRTYELTPAGQVALRDELARLDELLRTTLARRALAGRDGGKSG
jgi:DNA-binding PadR family transcriptional regulator